MTADVDSVFDTRTERLQARVGDSFRIGSFLYTVRGIVPPMLDQDGRQIVGWVELEITPP